ncbi:class I SAM-dependent methyltransferase [Risungbinella massiliensis]|uniref:class I SAM-dependent methyltransferase n=1 Tax=Risungbinella massiliensis TaxID=1329796 RepID=UPI000699F905|nr:class I SAM-dependent methyltransferase [Risungbinella massiliensis]
MQEKNNSMYNWPHYYDWTSTGMENDTCYYTELAKLHKGPVLELGCGTGRISLAIARESISLVGIDFSAQMLQSARKKAKAMALAGRTQWIEADMADFHVPNNRTFPLIISPYRSFQHLLKVEDQLRTLRQVRKHLRQDGVFAFHLFSPNMEQLLDLNRSYQFRGNYEVPGSYETVDVYDYTELDSFRQLLHVTRYYERFEETGKMIERVKSDFSIRYTFPTELRHLLAVNGFRIQNMYGDFDGTPFHEESEEMVIEAVLLVR